MKFGEMHCRIMTMTASDIGHIAAIERACFPVPWTSSAFLSELGNPYALNIILKEMDSLEKQPICAYSCNHVIENELSVLRMAVAPEKQRLGLGCHLMDTVLHQAAQRGATKAFLEVRPSNTKAISLYRKMGFQVIATRPNYYPETGEHALVMMKRIKEVS